MLDALKEFFVWLIDGFWFLVTELIFAVINLIPYPDFADTASSAIRYMVDQAGYFLWLGAFDVGLPMLITSLIARFILRRIPGIG